MLKTDVFDEAVGVGLFPFLRARAETVVGIDVSSGAVARAVAQYPELRAEQGDIRALACADGEFDLVVSNSTLDHLESLDDIRSGLAELYRVLRPGGVLVLTLDNVANPGVALRNRFPGLLRRLGVVPYPLGVTCGPSLARVLVREAGFDVVATGATMHVPRVLVLLMVRVLRPGSAGDTKLLRFLLGFERLSRLPTRYLTGQYVALRATKPVDEDHAT